MKLTYEDSGVSREKGYEEVSLIKELVKKTHTQDVLNDLGGFAGLMRINTKEMEEPVLVSGTDGVGTKLMIAQEMDRHDTIGIDLVAMCVNDVLCQGATPLFFLDYIATGELKPHKMKEIVSGVTEGCIQGKSALIGGETAEMPGLYGKDDYDLAGFSVGLVDKKDIITGEDIEKGHVAIALNSSGVHSNGYSLVRLVLEKNNIKFTDTLEGYDRSIGEVLLEPTRIYAEEVLSLLEKIKIRGIAHITGGGIYENIPRVLPKGLGLEVEVAQSDVPQIFRTLQELGGIETTEMFNTFNMGLGMVLFIAKEDVEQAEEILSKIGSGYRIVGEVTDEFEGVQLKWQD